MFIELTLKMGTTRCPETAVSNYRLKLHDIPEEQRPKIYTVLLPSLIYFLGTLTFILQ